MVRTLYFLAATIILTPAVDAAWIQDPAPGFELTALSGEKVSLGAQKGKVVFVHFWASWCGPCIVELPKLNELALTYKPEEFALLAITVDSAKGNIQKFLRQYVKAPLRAIVLHDPQRKIADVYQNRSMPITYVLDGRGVIRYVHLGFQKGDEARWRTEIDELRHEHHG